FDETREESFVSGALKDDSVARAPTARHRRLRVRDHLFERSWLPWNQIGATIQQSNVSKPRQGVELPRPCIRGDRSRKKFAARRTVTIKRKYPSRCSELRSPDDVELQDRWIPNSRI